MMPSMLEAAKGAFSCPPVTRLRELPQSGLPVQERRKVAYENVVELRAFMDAQFNSPMFGALLTAARMKEPEVPTKDRWLHGWGRIKSKMATDGKFTAAICDTLPTILARYTLADGARIFNDPDLRNLARRGME